MSALRRAMTPSARRPVVPPRRREGRDAAPGAAMPAPRPPRLVAMAPAGLALPAVGLGRLRHNVSILAHLH
eukprot:9488113-Pyramimonas_sp.AAC.1